MASLNYTIRIPYHQFQREFCNDDEMMYRYDKLVKDDMIDMTYRYNFVTKMHTDLQYRLTKLDDKFGKHFGNGITFANDSPFAHWWNQLVKETEEAALIKHNKDHKEKED